MKKENFPPNPSVLSENLKRQSIGKVSPEIQEAVSGIPLIHVTSQDRVAWIFESWVLLPLATLKKQWIQYDRMSVNTDKLDEKLWLDKYVFTTLGRNSFHNGGSISLVFRSKEILQRPWVLASLKEVWDYGALVSKEAEDIYRHARWMDPWRTNRIAVRKFLDGLVRGSDFSRLFAWFLQKNFTKYTEYLSTLTYPGEVLRVNELGSSNIWGWPQIMIPDSINLDGLTHVLTRTCAEAMSVLDQVAKVWMTVPVISLEDTLVSHGIDILPFEQTDTFMQLMNILVDERTQTHG